MLNTIIGVLLIIMAVFLVISVLMQSSKDHRHGVTVAGGAETFFGKNKGKSLDAMFNKLTTVVAIIFVLLVIVLYVVQPEPTVTNVVPEVETEESDVVEEPEAEVVEDDSDVAPAPEELLGETDVTEVVEDGSDATEEVVETETTEEAAEAVVEEPVAE